MNNDVKNEVEIKGNERPDPSPAVIRRLPRYYRYLCELIARGITRISSNELAHMGRRIRVVELPGIWIHRHRRQLLHRKQHYAAEEESGYGRITER